MWRWIRNALIVFSLLVFVAGSVFWIRSFWIGDAIHLEYRSNSTLSVCSFDQRFVIAWMDVAQSPDQSHDSFESKWTFQKDDRKPIDEVLSELNTLVADFKSVLGIRFYGQPKGNPASRLFASYPILYSVYALVVPFWFIVPPSAILPLWWLLRGRKSSKTYRRKHGLCLACGYDLRETSGACPECGRADGLPGGQ